MKNLILTLTMTMIAALSFGQKFIGFKGGYQVTNVTIDGISGIAPDARYMDNYTLGVYAFFPLKMGLGFQPEINLSQKGFVFKEDFPVDILGFEVPLGAEARTRIKYIESPLLLKYYNGDQRVDYYFEAGPVIGYAVDADVKTRINAIVDINIADTDINLQNDIYNRWEIGGMIGAGIGIPFGHTTINMGVRYQHSFSDLLNDPIIDVRARNYGFSTQLGLAYRF